jgi:hypothetical protein
MVMGFVAAGVLETPNAPNARMAPSPMIPVMPSMPLRKLKIAPLTGKVQKKAPV